MTNNIIVTLIIYNIFFTIICYFSDDTLLDEDLGDDEYDLGNDEEEALLADDYELERVSILLDHYFVVKWKLVHHYVSSYNIIFKFNIKYLKNFNFS